MLKDYGDISGGKVLIIADHQVNPDLMAGILSKRDIQVSIAVNQERGLKAALSQKPDLVLIDVVNSSMDGYGICKKLNMHSDTAGIPVIFLSPQKDPDDLVRAFEEGAVDYVAAPFHPSELLARVTTHLKIKMMECELLRQIRTDNLTGIWNQRYYRELLLNQIQQSTRGDHKLSMAVCDIDQYQEFSEKHGARGGDFILKAFSHELKKHIRKYDILGRYRTEQFAVAFPSCDRAAAGAVMQRLKELIESSSFGYENRPVKLSFSCGISEISEIDEKNILDELVKLSYERLSLSKESGWGKIVWDKRYFV